MKSSACCFFLFCFLIGCTKSSQHLNKTVVQVGTYQMSAKEFGNQMSSALKDIDPLTLKNPAYIQSSKQKIIEDFVYSSVIKNFADKNKIDLSKEELEKELNNIRKQYPDDISFRSALADEGFSIDDFIKNLKQNLINKKVEIEVSKDFVKPTEEELKQYYEKNKKLFKQSKAIKLRQIIVEKAIEAENIRKLLRKGEKFEDMAQKYSKGPSAERGGLLDWISFGTAEVFDKAFKLPVKSISKGIQSDFGYHIIQVLEKRSARQIPFSEAKESIERQLVEERRQSSFISWLQRESGRLKLLVDHEAISAIKVDIRDQ